MSKVISLLKPRASPLKPLIWQVSVHDTTAAITWGVLKGKVQTVTRSAPIGKQKRSPQEQILAEVEALALKKQTRDGYVVADDHQTDAAAVPLPMLATPFDPAASPLPSSSSIFVQPKLDGLRCLADVRTGILYSRARHVIHGLSHISSSVVAACAPHLARLSALNIQHLDGEIYAPGLDFQTISSLARRVTNPHANATALQLFVFDLVATSLPFSRRWDLIGALTPAGGLAVVSTTKIATADFDPLHHLQAQIDAGYEGAMYRLDTADSLYRPGSRSKHLLKHKAFHQEEFAVVEVNKHRELDTTGAVTLVTAHGVRFAATPACSAESKREIWANRDRYLDGKWVATCRFHELSSNGIPRFPRVVGFRFKDDV